MDDQLTSVVYVHIVFQASQVSFNGTNGGSNKTESYRLVCIRFLCTGSGTFSVQGVDNDDIALLPPLARKVLEPRRFKGLTAAVQEVRFVVSSRTRDLSLVWNRRRKGTGYYITDIQLVRSPAMLGRLLGLLDDMSVTEYVRKKTENKWIRKRSGATTLLVLRDPKQVEERSLYSACQLREGIQTATLSAGLLRAAYRDWAPVRAWFDIIWPFFFLIPFPVLFLGLHELGKDDIMLLTMPNGALITALVTMIFAQTMCLQKSCFYGTYRMMALGRFEWVVFDNRRWKNGAPIFLHLMHALVGTIILSQWAEISTRQGGTTLSKMCLVSGQLDEGKTLPS